MNKEINYVNELAKIVYWPVKVCVLFLIAYFWLILIVFVLAVSSIFGNYGIIVGIVLIGLLFWRIYSKDNEK